MGSTLLFNNQLIQALSSSTITTFLVLFAMVDANYKFIYIDVGAAGRAGDAGVFADSALNKALRTISLDLPDAVALQGL